MRLGLQIGFLHSIYLNVCHYNTIYYSISKKMSDLSKIGNDDISVISVGYIIRCVDDSIISHILSS